MSIKEQIAENAAKLNELKGALETGDSEAVEKAEALLKEKESLEASLKAAEKAQEMLTQIGAEQPAETEEKSMDMTAKSLGEHFVKNMPAEHEKRFSISAPDFKAYNDPLAIGTIASPQVPRSLVTDIDRNIVQEHVAPVYLRSLFGAETISGNALTFYIEGALEYATGKPYGFDVVDEGDPKPQISFADPTEKTVALTKIAAYIKETMEYIDDAPFLASAINGRLLNYLGLREEAFLLSSLAGTSGIGTDTTNWANADMTDAQAIADLIFEKLMKVQNDTGFAADAILLNPAVWQTLRLGKLTNDQYIGGGYFADGQGKQLWGVPVYTSSFVPAPVSGSATGDIWVGSFRNCASVVSKGGVSVEATNSNEDDFIKNKMTIRAEERIALAVRRPAGFIKITKSAS